MRVVGGRDLPEMDRNVRGEFYTDAYVDIKFRHFEYRTQIRRKTLNPVWDEEFRFDVADDSELQNEPIEFKVMDKDVYTADDAIGKVYMDLGPLLMRAADEEEQGDLCIKGWFPLYDTLRGVRGELYLVAKLRFIGDKNPFRESSAGVQFFGASFLNPELYLVTRVFGFVEELLVDNDPEFEWKDQFRQARSSNESRQALLYKLDATVRRQLGLKVQELGGNAVLGYLQDFDIEGDSGIVARAYGTACEIQRTGAWLNELQSRQEQEEGDGTLHYSPSKRSGHHHHHHHHHSSHHLRERSTSGQVDAPGPPPLLSTRKASTGYAGEEAKGGEIYLKNLGEVVILTLCDFMRSVKLRVGGLVLARSVKYLGKLATSMMDQETRDGWWAELRDEIRSHAKVLCCTHVIGYTETTTIYDDVMILSATGTAATLRRDCPLPSLPTSAPPPPPNYSSPPIPASEVAGNDAPSPASSESGVSLSNSRDGAQVSSRRQSVDGEGGVAIPAGLGGEWDEEGNLTADGSESCDRSQAEQSAALGLSSSVRMGTGNRARKMSCSSWQSNPQRRLSCSADAAGAANGAGDSVPSPDTCQWPRPSRPCSYCHVPYNHRQAPFDGMRLVPCGVCGRKWVPQTILATIEPPSGLAIRGEPSLVEAKVCRVVRRGASSMEADATRVSESLPFLEYELQRQLMLRLKVMSMNAVFSLRCQLSVGPSLIVGTMTGTAMYLEALPAPPVLRIALKHTRADTGLMVMQGKVSQLCASTRQKMVALAPAPKKDRRRRRQSDYERSGSGTVDGSSRAMHSASGSHRLRQSERRTAHSGRQNLSLIEEETSRAVFEGDADGQLSTSGEIHDNIDSVEVKEAGAPRRPSSASNTLRVAPVKTNLSSARNKSSAASNLSPSTNSVVSSCTSDSSDSGSDSSSSSSSSSGSSGDSSGSSTSSESRGSRAISSSKEVLDAYSDDEQEEREERSQRRRHRFRDSKSTFLLEVDDETDADMLMVLLDKQAPAGVMFIGGHSIPGMAADMANAQLLVAMQRAKWNGTSEKLSPSLSELFSDLHARLAFKCRHFAPCIIYGLKTRVNLTGDNMIELVVSGMAVLQPAPRIAEVAHEARESAAPSAVTDGEEREISFQDELLPPGDLKKDLSSLKRPNSNLNMLHAAMLGLVRWSGPQLVPRLLSEYVVGQMTCACTIYIRKSSFFVLTSCHPPRSPVRVNSSCGSAHIALETESSATVVYGLYWSSRSARSR